MLVTRGGKQSRLAHVDADGAVLDIDRFWRGGSGSRCDDEQQEKPDFDHPGQSSPPSRQSRLVGGNLRLVLECEPNFVQALEQAMTGEFLDRKLGREALIIVHPAALKIDGKLIVGCLRGT